VEPVVEDIHILSLRSKGRCIAWLRFSDVPARNAFILNVRPLIQLPKRQPSVEHLFGEGLKQWLTRRMVGMRSVITLCCNGSSIAITHRRGRRVSFSTTATSKVQQRVRTNSNEVVVPPLNFAVLKQSNNEKQCTDSDKVVVPVLNFASLKQNDDIGDFEKEHKRHASGTLDTIDTINEGDESASSASSDGSWCTGSFCAMSNAEGTTAKTFAMSEACGSYVADGNSLETGLTPSFIAMTEGGDSFYAMTEGCNSFATTGNSFCAMFDKFQQQHTKLELASEDPWDVELRLLDYHFF
jgi:hypothetical protein